MQYVLVSPVLLRRGGVFVDTLCQSLSDYNHHHRWRSFPWTVRVELPVRARQRSGFKAASQCVLHLLICYLPIGLFAQVTGSR